MRQDESNILDSLMTEADTSTEKTGITKTASTEKNASIEKTASMPLFQARVARRQGKFIKVAGRMDLYQDVETKDFWKISDDKQNVIRVVEENNGLVKE